MNTATHLKVFKAKPGDTISLGVIAVINDNDTWTAYRGSAKFSTELIIASGNIVPEAAARPLFPALGTMVYKGK